jgi:putative molybdopterin biosynthesis protein
MSVYLHDIPLPVAKARLQSTLEQADLWRVLGTENIPLNENAIGRVLAEPVWAKISSPHYHASAMDGFAVRVEDTLGSEPGSPRILFQFVYVDTGDALPEGFDAVIPIENVESLDVRGEITPAIHHTTSIRIRAAVTPWSNIRPLGEDIVQSQLVLPAGQVLRPVDLGAIAASGHQSVMVARKPRVAIIPTGSELVPLGSDMKAGDILEFNSLVLAAQVLAWGGNPTRFSITKDNFGAICDRVVEAAREHDLILLNAGSSAGTEDFSAKVVERLGTLLVHGVAVRPGHPVILGMVSMRGATVEKHEVIPSHEENANPSGTIKPGEESLPQSTNIPIIGVPGYPVSAALTGEIFVEPLIAKWTGRQPLELQVTQAYLTRKIASPGGDDEYVRVAVGKVGDKLVAAPLARGAGVISSLVHADGLVLLPSGVQGGEAGDAVEVSLYRSLAELYRTIFCIGSHDMTLDLLAQFLSLRNRRLASANVGSQGGLIALKRGEAHLAGCHLLDPETGEYNLSYIRQYLSGVSVKVYGFVGREQGLMVRRGNPKGVKSLKDLSRTEIHFVNRQRGAGTRVLLEYQLSKMGISVEAINGYNLEEYTHLGVAAAVASGRADCGLGIPAAAHSLNLDFIPLFQETYQLIIPKIYAESDLLIPLFEVLEDQGFQQAIMKMPGYDVNQMGRLMAEV